jgi:transcriptional regulator with XRE-family HTH domain
MRYEPFSPEILVSLRLEKRLSQVELAKGTGISQSAISQYEKGQRNPTVDVLTKIGKFLDVHFVADWDGHLKKEK